MIKNALKNFFKNSLYIFIPMGIIYLVFLVAVVVFVGGLVDISRTMIGDMFTLIKSSSQQSQEALAEFFAYSANRLEWDGSVWDLLRKLLTTSWLKDTVVGFFETLNMSTENFGEQTSQIVSAFLGGLRGLIAGVVSLCVFGIVFANFITRIAVRSRTAKRGVKKFILAHTCVPLAEAVLLIGFGLLFTVIKYYTLIALPVFLIAAVSMALTSSWIIHRDKSLKLRDVVTKRNILQHLGAVGLILLINIALAVVLFLLNPLLAILIMLPVVIYSLNIADVNTDSIVCRLIEEKKQALAAAPAGETATAPAEGTPATPETPVGELPAEDAGTPAETAESTDGEPASAAAPATAPAESPAEGDPASAAPSPDTPA